MRNKKRFGSAHGLTLLKIFVVITMLLFLVFCTQILVFRAHCSIDNQVPQHLIFPAEQEPNGNEIDWKAAFLEAIPHAAAWQCDSHPALRAFQLAPFPLHYLPSHGNMPHASIFAETKLGSCDLLSHDESAEPCTRVEHGSPDAPDTWLEEFIETVMHRNPGCQPHNSENKELPSCNVVDVGSNLGLVSMRLLQMGATRLISVEPQADLCCAGRQSAIYNGYGPRSLFLCGGITDDNQTNATLKISDSFYRLHDSKFRAEHFIKSHGLPNEVPLYPLDRVFLPRSENKFEQYAFVKLDTDSFDCDLLRSLWDHQRRGVLSMDAISLETWTGLCNNNEQFSQLLFDIQQDGYTIYRAEAAMKSTGSETIYQQYDLYDSHPDLTAQKVPLITTTLLEFKKMSLQEWQETKKDWRLKYQMGISKILLSNGTGQQIQGLPALGHPQQFASTPDTQII